MKLNNSKWGIETIGISLALMAVPLVLFQNCSGDQSHVSELSSGSAILSETNNEQENLSVDLASDSHPSLGSHEGQTRAYISPANTALIQQVLVDRNNKFIMAHIRPNQREGGSSIYFHHTYGPKNPGAVEVDNSVVFSAPHLGIPIAPELHVLPGHADLEDGRLAFATAPRDSGNSIRLYGMDDLTSRSLENGFSEIAAIVAKNDLLLAPSISGNALAFMKIGSQRYDIVLRSGIDLGKSQKTIISRAINSELPDQDLLMKGIKLKYSARGRGYIAFTIPKSGGGWHLVTTDLTNPTVLNYLAETANSDEIFDIELAEAHLFYGVIGSTESVKGIDLSRGFTYRLGPFDGARGINQPVQLMDIATIGNGMVFTTTQLAGDPAAPIEVTRQALGHSNTAAPELFTDLQFNGYQITGIHTAKDGVFISYRDEKNQVNAIVEHHSGPSYNPLFSGEQTTNNQVNIIDSAIENVSLLPDLYHSNNAELKFTHHPANTWYEIQLNALDKGQITREWKKASDLNCGHDISPYLVPRVGCAYRIPKVLQKGKYLWWVRPYTRSNGEWTNQKYFEVK